MKEKKSSGWVAVVVWLILFWPVGLILLFKKFHDKTALMSGMTTVASTVAWILIAFSALMLLSNIGRLTEDAYVSLIFVAWLTGGILILLKVRKSKAKAAQYKKYLNVIVNAGERSIDNIAGALSVPYDDAHRDIKAMIDDGFLHGAYIHEGNRAVVLSQDILAQQAVYVSPGQGVAPPQPRTVRCSGCGANNVVTGGKITECEYCATPLGG